jgi:hypothetical protein
LLGKLFCYPVRVGVKCMSDEEFVADRNDLSSGLPRPLPRFFQVLNLLVFLEGEDRRECSCKGASGILSETDYDEILVRGL